MKNYFFVLRLFLVNMFRRRSEKSSSYMWIVYAIIGCSALVLSVALGFAVFAISPYFSDINTFITFLFIVSFFVVIFFSLFSMLMHLYFAKDAEFFLTLPISPSVIYFAKLTIVYLVELLVVVIALLPSLIMIGISMSLGVVYFVTMVLAIFIVPMFPLVFTSIIAIPLMYLVSYLKNKGAVTSLIAIFLFSAAMGVYIYFAMSLSGTADPEGTESMADLVAFFENGIRPWSYIFYPFLALSRFATLANSQGSLPLSMLINLLIFLGSAGILFTLALIISNLAYKRGIAKNLENNVSKNSKGKDKHRSAIKSLIIQEWRGILRNPTFALQCLSYIILCPIMTVIFTFMIFKNGGQGEYIWVIATSMISLFGVSTNIAAQTAITRQGETFYYSKTIPVDYRIQIKAKLGLYAIITTPSILLSMGAVVFFTSQWWIVPFAVIYLSVLGYAANCFSVWFDLGNPKLNWTTYTEAVKHNKNVTVNTLVNMVASIVLTGVFLLIYALLNMLLGNIGILITYLVMTIFAAVPAAIFHKVLYSRVDSSYSRLP